MPNDGSFDGLTDAFEEMLLRAKSVAWQAVETIAAEGWSIELSSVVHEGTTLFRAVLSPRCAFVFHNHSIFFPDTPFTLEFFGKSEDGSFEHITLSQHPSMDYAAFKAAVLDLVKQSPAFLRRYQVPSSECRQEWQAVPQFLIKRIVLGRSRDRGLQPCDWIFR